MLTPVIGHSGAACVQFAYHVYGDNTGTLELFTIDSLTGTKINLWKMEGGQQRVWLTKQVQLVTPYYYSKV